MKVSVITVNYNDKEGLEKTIQGVVSQTFADFEFIIIDGGSTDGGFDILKKYDSQISCWVSEPDKGIYNAMNKGIHKANGDYCIFMNSGDVFVDSKTMESVFSKAKGEDIICGNTLMPNVKYPPKTISLDYLFINSICHQCAFIKTDLLRKHPYDESYRIVSDRKFFLQALILDNCSYESVDVDVVIYDTNGLSAQNRFLSEQEYQKVLEELIPARIRMDYGAKNFGQLYGDTDYDKLFLEIKQRNYCRMIYTMSVLVIRFFALFKKSANFIKVFPLRIK